MCNGFYGKLLQLKKLEERNSPPTAKTSQRTGILSRGSDNATHKQEGAALWV